MNIYPAIDLLAGRVVRLLEGDRERATVYSDDPPALIAEFVAAGADRVHVVDLDGAFSGTRAHRAVVEGIVAASSVPIQVGGGVRDQAALEAVFAAGVEFAVLGTAAVKSPEFARAACAAYPGRIIIAVDARDGVVAVEGWVELAEVSALELGKRAAGWGAGGLLYTDVARDGAQVGPNVAATRALAEAVDIPVIASGGVASLDDIKALAEAGIPAVVVGRALYERRFTLAEAIAVARAASSA